MKLPQGMSSLIQRIVIKMLFLLLHLGKHQAYHLKISLTPIWLVIIYFKIEIDEIREPSEKDGKKTPLTHGSSESEEEEEDSEATIIKDNVDIDVDFIYEKDPQELMKTSAILEDIDLYINKLKTKQNKAIPITVDRPRKDSEATIEIKNNTNNNGNNMFTSAIVNNNLEDENSSDNSVFNFIKNTKKLNQAGTIEKKPYQLDEKKIIEEVKKEEVIKKDEKKEEEIVLKAANKKSAIKLQQDTVEKKPGNNDDIVNNNNNINVKKDPKSHFFTDGFKVSMVNTSNNIENIVVPQSQANTEYKIKPVGLSLNNTSNIASSKNNIVISQPPVNQSLEPNLVNDYKRIVSKKDPQFNSKDEKDYSKINTLKAPANDALLTKKESQRNVNPEIIVTGSAGNSPLLTKKESMTSPTKHFSMNPVNTLNPPKSLENEIANKINTVEIKERRKTKILEMAQNTPIYWKISKDQMIKISSEPISQHYIILGDLGNGAYGMVKRVKHKKLTEERAMKIVKKKSESSVNEIEILKKISHPNIISIYEIFEDAKSYYIMTELLDGGELFEEISNRGSFSEIDAAKIMKQLLSAVNYLHNKNIVHRDLKPENIMMINKNSNNFEIKIIDFGTSKLFDNKTEKLTKFIGTSYYIAPEVLAECYDEKCDIWSCGVILYILFCGYPPFSGASNLDIYHAIKYSSPNFTSDEWKEVSKDAIDLITCMLTKNPTKRYSAEQCLNHKWVKSMDDFEKDMRNKIKFNPLKAIKKMTAFLQENKLKQTVIQFISTQFNLKEEEQMMRSLFEQFDSEKKGVISIQAFTEVLSKIFGENEAKLYAEKIFNNIDNDGNGEISYNEFITSLLDKRSLEKNHRIEKAFKLIDKVL
jgi:calcium-dependent protein kinase